MPSFVKADHMSRKFKWGWGVNTDRRVVSEAYFLLARKVSIIKMTRKSIPGQDSSHLFYKIWSVRHIVRVPTWYVLSP